MKTHIDTFIFIFGISIFITLCGCTIGFNIIQETPCQMELPQEVIDYFDGYGEEFKFFDNKKEWSIEKGTHEDLFITRFGVIESRQYNWKTNIKYEAHLYYDNKDYALIRTGSHVDKFRVFSPVRLWWIVLRKKDGKIIQTLEQSGMIDDKIIFDDVLYLRMIYSDKDSQIVCLNIGE